MAPPMNFFYIDILRKDIRSVNLLAANVPVDSLAPKASADCQIHVLP